MTKYLALAAALLFSLSLAARGGSVETRFVRDTSAEEPTPRDIFSVEDGYVFPSQLSSDGVDYGDQDAFEITAQYGHRFHLGGKWFFGAGVIYNRFTFGDSAAPVPDHLHSIAGVFSLDYMVGSDRGAFLEIQPGFYGENDWDTDSFDIPVTLARAWILKPDRIYLFTGVNYAGLRGQFPVIPLVGLIWRFNDQWILYGVVPNPRLVYMPNKHLDLWIGGQITGGSFRTDKDPTIVPAKLSGAQVDYSDYRAGAGFVWHISDAVDLDIGGGYSIQRRFNYERAGKDFTTEPAPYLRASFKAEF